MPGRADHRLLVVGVLLEVSDGVSDGEGVPALGSTVPITVPHCSLLDTLRGRIGEPGGSAHSAALNV